MSLACWRHLDDRSDIYFTQMIILTFHKDKHSLLIGQLISAACWVGGMLAVKAQLIFL